MTSSDIEEPVDGTGAGQGVLGGVGISGGQRTLAWTWQPAPAVLLAAAGRPKRKLDDEGPSGHDAAEDGEEKVADEDETRFRKYYRFTGDDIEALTEAALSEGKTLELRCTLTPTCARLPPFTTYADYESHHANFHENSCVECHRVLATRQLHHLHLLELHDAFFLAVAARENAYECFVEDCHRKFSGPFSRRLHLVSAHKFPKDFEFENVVLGHAPNVGRDWTTKEWNSRHAKPTTYRKPPQKTEKKTLQKDENANQNADEMTDQNADQKAPKSKQRRRGRKKKTTSMDVEGQEEENTPLDAETSEETASSSNMASGDISESTTPADQPINPTSSDPMEDIVKSMSALKLVPRQIRFGRSAARTGFATAIPRTGKPEPPLPTDTAMEATSTPTPPTPSSTSPTPTPSTATPQHPTAPAPPRLNPSHPRPSFWSLEKARHVYRSRVSERAKQKQHDYVRDLKAHQQQRRERNLHVMETDGGDQDMEGGKVVDGA
ncbi:hypothetical protein HDU96_010519 [Phlyctochytrium bullatum]|nr:hypothetical protein HDU96_010519 [Phlyctochytrium bullatum]